jgi:hypothetical protein
MSKLVSMAMPIFLFIQPEHMNVNMNMGVSNSTYPRFLFLRWGEEWDILDKQ